MHQVGLVTSQEEEEEGAGGSWGIWVMQQLSAADLSLTLLYWTLSSLFTLYIYIIYLSSEIYSITIYNKTTLLHLHNRGMMHLMIFTNNIYFLLLQLYGLRERKNSK